jgi:hypothetical protein
MAQGPRISIPLDIPEVRVLSTERSLIVLLVNSTISDVLAKEDVTYDALLGILDRWIASSVDWDQVAPFSSR